MAARNIVAFLLFPRRSLRKIFRKLVWLKSPAQLHQLFMSSQLFSEDVDECLEAFRSEITDHPEKQKGPLFPVFYDSGPRLQALIARLVEDYSPQVVVETGVARGRLTRIILGAFEKRAKGSFDPGAVKPILHSIDVDPRTRHPDLASNPHWVFHLLAKGKDFESVFRAIGQCDLFIHDSDHSYENQAKEYALAWENLRVGGFLVSDDINWSNAFLDFCASRGLSPIILSDATTMSGIVRKSA